MLRVASLINKTAYPAAGAAASSAALDLGTGGGSGLQGGVFAFDHPALAALADTKTVTTDLMHCDTAGGTYAVVEGYGNMVLTGAGGAGVAAKVFRMPIADHVKRFVKMRVTLVASSGDVTASSFTFAIERP